MARPAAEFVPRQHLADSVRARHKLCDVCRVPGSGRVVDGGRVGDAGCAC